MTHFTGYASLTHIIASLCLTLCVLLMLPAGTLAPPAGVAAGALAEAAAGPTQSLQALAAKTAQTVMLRRARMAPPAAGAGRAGAAQQQPLLPLLQPVVLRTQQDCILAAAAAAWGCFQQQQELGLMLFQLPARPGHSSSTLLPHLSWPTAAAAVGL
jgi:hypothetical protein